MTSRVSRTCERGHLCSLYYEAVKNSFSGNVKLTVRKCLVKWEKCIWTCINKSFTDVFQLLLTVNSKSTYIMNIFLRALEKYTCFLSFFSFSVFTYQWRGLNAAKFAAAFYRV